MSPDPAAGRRDDLAIALTYYHPTRAAWLDPGARAVTCVVWDPDGKLDTAVWDSGR